MVCAGALTPPQSDYIFRALTSLQTKEWDLANNYFCVNGLEKISSCKCYEAAIVSPCVFEYKLEWPGSKWSPWMALDALVVNKSISSMFHSRKKKPKTKQPTYI